jgi:hypothetical protein
MVSFITGSEIGWSFAKYKFLLSFIGIEPRFLDYPPVAYSAPCGDSEILESDEQRERLPDRDNILHTCRSKATCGDEECDGGNETLNKRA